MDEQFSGLPQSVRKRTHVGGLGRSRRCEQGGADLGNPGLERADRRVHGRDGGEGVVLAVGNHTARAFRRAFVKRRIERADRGFDLGLHHRACNPRQRIDRGDCQAVDGDMQPFGQCDRAQEHGAPLGRGALLHRAFEESQMRGHVGEKSGSPHSRVSRRREKSDRRHVEPPARARQVMPEHHDQLCVRRIGPQHDVEQRNQDNADDHAAEG